MTAALRAVLFDAVGTLIELREPLGETYARVAHAHGAAISPWRLEEAFARVRRTLPPLDYREVGRDEIPVRERAWWREFVRRTFLAADSAVRPADFDACFEALFAHFAAASAWRARPGAAAALAGLRADGVARAVVSDFDRRLPAILGGLGLGVDAIVLPSDAGVAKPEPAIFQLALARLGVAAHEALFVGDDAERDLAGARAAGLQAIDVGGLATLAELPALLREGRLATPAPCGAPAPPSPAGPGEKEPDAPP